MKHKCKDANYCNFARNSYWIALGGIQGQRSFRPQNKISTLVIGPIRITYNLIGIRQLPLYSGHFQVQFLENENSSVPKDKSKWQDYLLPTHHWRPEAIAYQNYVETPLGQGERVGFADAISGPSDKSPVATASLDVEGACEKPAVHEVEEPDGKASANVDKRRKPDPLQPWLQSVRHCASWNKVRK